LRGLRGRMLELGVTPLGQRGRDRQGPAVPDPPGDRGLADAEIGGDVDLPFAVQQPPQGAAVAGVHAGEQLVLQALGSGRATRQELAKIRALLDELEGRD
ncbi:MAG: hypothetical protein KY410_09425, partial [Proteobacteria bacterium]|nr:hypothetical protein [Pseudomonadota bacterium]